MSKKSFNGGINSVLGETPEQIKKRNSVTASKKITKTSQRGTKENETRATFIVKEELLDKLKSIAYWDRVLIKEVINTALEEAVLKYEKKNGTIKKTIKK